MTRTHFTIHQDGQRIFSTPDIDQAVNGAKTRATETGRDVSVVAHYLDAPDKEVIFHADGTAAHIWKIDRGEPFVPKFGEIYRNAGGGRFECMSRVNDLGFATMRNVKSGWQFIAKEIIRYCDGSIEWSHSVGGQFMEVSA